VIGGEVLGRNDDLVQVGLQQLRDHVDLLKEVEVRRLQKKSEHDPDYCNCHADGTATYVQGVSEAVFIFVALTFPGSSSS
jgi:hypothetical protein